LGHKKNYFVWIVGFHLKFFTKLLKNFVNFASTKINGMKPGTILPLKFPIFCLFPIYKMKVNNVIVIHREYLRGKYHCTIDLLFDWLGTS
jgi:hypothetical protein